jgi:hypothetical protein
VNASVNKEQNSVKSSVTKDVKHEAAGCSFMRAYVWVV